MSGCQESMARDAREPVAVDEAEMPVIKVQIRTPYASYFSPHLGASVTVLSICNAILCSLIDFDCSLSCIKHR